LQKLICKNLNIDKFLENVAFAASQGVFCNGFAMMGFPTETEDELQQTIDVACSSRLHSISFFTVTPFPGTELYRMVEQSNPRLLGNIRYDDIEYAGIPVNLSAVPDETLFYYQRKANHRFYLSPVRLARMMRDFPQPYLLPLYIPVFIKRSLKGKINRSV
jgi:anaerobic magnesium-protoporphyrin IX monomethyl ester cyclase